MDYEIRAITEDEFEQLERTLMTAFGEDGSPENTEAQRKTFEFDRSLTAVDGGELVAAAGAYSFDLTLPGGTTAPVAGVTWVGVLPTHRRRGILSAMMQSQLDDVAERGEPLAVLTASEAVIYGRYGYGVATQVGRADIATHRSEFVAEPAVGGRIRLLDAEAARKVLPGLYDTYRGWRPGELSRNDRWWDSYFMDLTAWRDGASSRYYAVHEDDSGEADGYVSYRVKETWSPENPGNTVYVVHVHAVDPEVEAALFRYLLDIDLILKLSCWYRPVDDPIRWRLANSRGYRVTSVTDWLWARPVDVAAALAARRYSTEDRLVIEVTDPFRPANDGKYALDGGPDGATCSRSGEAGTEADVRLSVDALGAAYLGGITFSTLAAAGRVAGDPEALRRADAMFASTPTAFCDVPF